MARQKSQNSPTISAGTEIADRTTPIREQRQKFLCGPLWRVSVPRIIGYANSAQKTHTPIQFNIGELIRPYRRSAKPPSIAPESLFTRTTLLLLAAPAPWGLDISTWVALHKLNPPMAKAIRRTDSGQYQEKEFLRLDHALHTRPALFISSHRPSFTAQN